MPPRRLAKAASQTLPVTSVVGARLVVFGSREVPIHRKLKPIVLRRCKDKKPEEFLFPELPDATALRPRSAAASQAFTRYRRNAGIDEAPNEKRTSNVDFHSFRRWFITKAEQAGQHPHIIEAVVGHKRHGESMGRYSQGPSVDQLKACVESVKLPIRWRGEIRSTHPSR